MYLEIDFQNNIPYWYIHIVETLHSKWYDLCNHNAILSCDFKQYQFSHPKFQINLLFWKRKNGSNIEFQHKG